MLEGRQAMHYSPEYLAEYNGNRPYRVAIVFLCLETICVTLRFWARRIGKVAWGADDTLIIPGTIFCLAVCACAIADVFAGGLGHHEAAIAMSDPAKLIVWSKFVLVLPLVYLAAVVFPKLAILAIYLRIFTKKPYRVTCWVLAGLLIVNWIAVTITGLLICRPLAFLWNRSIIGGHCYNINAWFRWGSLVNILTDVVMLILPLPVVWGIQTSRKIKLALTVTFATGSVGLITSVIRFVGFFTTNAVVDITYSGTDLVVWTVCESGMYLIAACLPTYRPVATLLWRRAPSSLRYLGLMKSHSSDPKSRDRGFNIALDSQPQKGFARIDDKEAQFSRVYRSENFESRAERGGVWAGQAVGQGTIVVRKDVDTSETQAERQRSVGNLGRASDLQRK